MVEFGCVFPQKPSLIVLARYILSDRRPRWATSLTVFLRPQTTINTKTDILHNISNHGKKNLTPSLPETLKTTKPKIKDSSGLLFLSSSSSSCAVVAVVAVVVVVVVE